MLLKEYDSNGKNHPIIPSEELPPPLPKPAPESAEDEANQDEPLLDNTNIAESSQAL
jgi:hypothetical protein